jgi:ribosomal protein S18 acetylase RimI-like enzyme
VNERVTRLEPADVEAIERATLATVSPDDVEELAGWLLPFDPGTIGRATNAVPLRHDRADPAMVAVIERRYAARGLAARFRIADDERLESLRATLEPRGYRGAQPTLVETGSAALLRERITAAPASLTREPDAAWASVYTGEGFDPVDGACRVRAFSRARDVVFARAQVDGATVAVGVGAFGFGWASVHGMRTAPAHRRRGLARSVLVALAGAALERGIDRLFLQVEEGNAPARALYNAAGFRIAWRYRYWRAQG